MTDEQRKISCYWRNMFFTFSLCFGLIRVIEHILPSPFIQWKAYEEGTDVFQMVLLSVLSLSSADLRFDTHCTAMIHSDKAGKISMEIEVFDKNCSICKRECRI